MENVDDPTEQHKLVVSHARSRGNAAGGMMSGGVGM